MATKGVEECAASIFRAEKSTLISRAVYTYDMPAGTHIQNFSESLPIMQLFLQSLPEETQVSHSHSSHKIYTCSVYICAEEYIKISNWQITQ